MTVGIYALINDEKLIVRRGVLRRSDLRRVLKSTDYPEDKHDFLLLLMKKFELCSPLDDEMNEWLVPELLPKKGPKPGPEFYPKTTLFFEYHYETLLPHGLTPRFISRTYPRIVDELRWRTGVVVDWMGAKALVRADADKKRVEIRVSGKELMRQECLHWVSGHFPRTQFGSIALLLESPSCPPLNLITAVFPAVLLSVSVRSPPAFAMPPPIQLAPAFH